ncbi:MAG: TerB family tellurite resistance protein [Gammaproteobacteria bacterium]|nr:TerB family tellurite resistance protein [Gammaproteobacteria bacterium]
MIKRLIDQVVNVIATPERAESSAKDREAALRLATAVLMIDVARADHEFDESEFDRILELVRAHFKLEPEDAAQLVVAANERSDEAVSAYEFTQLLHEHLDEEEKTRIVSLLWQIAYADGRLDKYEDAFVLKISDLLYVSRGRVMQLKHDAKQNT